MPYLFRVVFWKRKGVISRQSAVMCELARRVLHLCFGWGSVVSDWLDCGWESVTRDWVSGQRLCVSSASSSTLFNFLFKY